MPSDGHPIQIFDSQPGQALHFSLIRPVRQLRERPRATCWGRAAIRWAGPGYLDYTRTTNTVCDECRAQMVKQIRLDVTECENFRWIGKMSG